jgi:hypothetical protein
LLIVERAPPFSASWSDREKKQGAMTREMIQYFVGFARKTNNIIIIEQE